MATLAREQLRPNDNRMTVPMMFVSRLNCGRKGSGSLCGGQQWWSRGCVQFVRMPGVVRFSVMSQSVWVSCVTPNQDCHPEQVELLSPKTLNTAARQEGSLLLPAS